MWYNKEKYMQIVDASFLSDVGNLGFNFEWHKLLCENKIVVGLYIDAKLVGLVSFSRETRSYFNQVALLEVSAKNRGNGYGGKLIALVSIDSFQHGFEGYVQLISKTNGVEKFYDYLGATRYGQNVIIDTKISQQIINKYLPNGGEIRWIIKWLKNV